MLYCCVWNFVFRCIVGSSNEITLLHLLIFVFLTCLLLLLPVIPKPENKAASFLTNLQSLKKVSSLKPHNLLSTLIFLMNLFEYMFQNTFGVHFIWTAGFISWISGCCFWLLHADSASLLLICASIIFCLLAIYDTYKFKLCDVSALRRSKPSFTPYLLFISISVLTMVAFNSLAIGLTMNILFLLFLYNWRLLKKPKQKQDATSIE
jgi:hypothetical protein